MAFSIKVVVGRAKFSTPAKALADMPTLDRPPGNKLMLAPVVYPLASSVSVPPSSMMAVCALA